MEKLLHVVDNIGDIIECYALGYPGDAKTRLVALQEKLVGDQYLAKLIHTDVMTVVTKAYADTMAGDKSAAVSALSRLNRQLWQRYWKDNEAHSNHPGEG